MANKPQIILGHEAGIHNTSEQTVNRLEKGRAYKDMSTVVVIPTRGMIPARVVESWWGLMPPMNGQFTRLIVKGMEVGEAYTAAVEMILQHPVLKDWKYMLTLEEDNLPPPDGLLQLHESIEGYAAVGGLYWTKGEGGQPMIYGDTKSVFNFRPQIPIPDTLQECNGLGMGFTLWDLSVFRDERLQRPWFKTVQEWDPNSGVKMYTQDLYAYENIRKLGYKIACDTRVKVGHLDVENDIVW